MRPEPNTPQPQASYRRAGLRVSADCHLRPRMRAVIVLALLLAGATWPICTAHAQDAAATEATLPSASALLAPSTHELSVAVAGLRIAKWKAPGPVKDDAQSNTTSIARDLDATLPGLVAQSDAAPHSVANAFAVYRNLDALYEVLLRVSGTADLAASDEEAASLTHALGTLEAARRSWAESILSVSHAQESALVQRRAAATAASPTPPAAAQTTIVSDGPAATAARRKAKTKAAAPVKTPPS